MKRSNLFSLSGTELFAFALKIHKGSFFSLMIAERPGRSYIRRLVFENASILGQNVLCALFEFNDVRTEISLIDLNYSPAISSLMFSIHPDRHFFGTVWIFRDCPQQGSRPCIIRTWTRQNWWVLRDMRARLLGGDASLLESVMV